MMLLQSSEETPPSDMPQEPTEEGIDKGSEYTPEQVAQHMIEFGAKTPQEWLDRLRSYGWEIKPMGAGTSGQSADQEEGSSYVEEEKKFSRPPVEIAIVRMKAAKKALKDTGSDRA